MDDCFAATVFLNRVEIHLYWDDFLTDIFSLCALRLVHWCIVGCLGHCSLVV